ncbi:hypothetical protein KC19_9G028500 [Ceratodon purpureus]|uniref:Uncharacterized protein n=1 Tax=Ceratodon purpureus TaxID=3225 RepID=A0A8T0GN60_CERPU|nr:hypothetical protein KC19_9G028500 [Ceratodon purpureus]
MASTLLWTLLHNQQSAWLLWPDQSTRLSPPETIKKPAEKELKVSATALITHNSTSIPLKNSAAPITGSRIKEVLVQASSFTGFVTHGRHYFLCSSRNVESSEGINDDAIQPQVLAETPHS